MITKRIAIAYTFLFLFVFTFALTFTLASKAYAFPDCCIVWCQSNPLYYDYYGTVVRGECLVQGPCGYGYGFCPE